MKNNFSKMVIMIIITGTFSTLIFGQGGWEDQSPKTLYPGMVGVYAIDADNIWVVGERGLILHSESGGERWDPITSGTTRSLFAVEFINADTGWVAGDDDFSTSTVLRTTDGGSTWEPQALSGNVVRPIYDLDFIKVPAGDSIPGYITGGSGFTWKTWDLGESWGSVRNNSENTFYSSCFVNRDTGWFVGSYEVTDPYTIMCTLDGGESWIEQTNPTDKDLRGVSFGSDQKGIAVGLSGSLIYTSDGGTNWEASAEGGFTRWESVFLTTSGKAWAVGIAGAIAHSDDWGHTWVMQESGVSAGVELMEVFFIDDNQGWIVGGGVDQSGVILHTTSGGLTTGLQGNRPEEEGPFSLAQNFPNPFRAKTRIQYTVTEPASVRVEIFDATGQLLATLQDQQMPAGSHYVDFDGEFNPAGVYFYSVEAGSSRAVRKMVLMK